jgi:hypothetical protein
MSSSSALAPALVSTAADASTPISPPVAPSATLLSTGTTQHVSMAQLAATVAARNDSAGQNHQVGLPDGRDLPERRLPSFPASLRTTPVASSTSALAPAVRVIRINGHIPSSIFILSLSLPPLPPPSLQLQGQQQQGQQQQRQQQQAATVAKGPPGVANTVRYITYLFFFFLSYLPHPLSPFSPRSPGISFHPTSSWIFLPLLLLLLLLFISRPPCFFYIFLYPLVSIVSRDRLKFYLS